jgi:hypothetical protein
VVAPVRGLDSYSYLFLGVPGGSIIVLDSLGVSAVQF